MALLRSLVCLGLQLILLPLTVLAQPYDCKPGCTQRGNCDLETRKCECDFGYTGDECEIDLIPACRDPLNDNQPLLSHINNLLPCQCFQQWIPLISIDIEGSRCDSFVCPLPKATACFNRTSLGDKPRVDFPAESEKGVVYYRGYMPGTQKKITRAEAVKRTEHTNNVPLSECPGECNHRGSCAKNSKSPKAQGVCSCMYGSSGPECQHTYNFCVNGCSGRGTCKMSSFCHCEPGYWGLGCHRSRAFPQGNGLRHPTEFKIYIYNLPLEIANERGWHPYWDGHDPNYLAFKDFNNQLLNSSVFTENPWEASLFYIPAFSYHYTSNLGKPDVHLTRTIEYVRATHPWWNRTEGRDHIVWTPQDRGSCSWGNMANNTLHNHCIKLTHFGYFDHGDPHPWSTAEDRMVLSIPNRIWGCYHPLKDVVMPPNDIQNPAAWAQHYMIDHLQTPEQAWEHRKKLLFFSGSIRPDDKAYAGGTRLRISKMLDTWKEDEEIELGQTRVQGIYPEYFRNAKYCIAPYGHGYGIRLLEAAVAGCVPVIIQEHVYQYLEDVLPYEEFTVRLNNEDIERLPEILRSITKEQYMQLYDGVCRYYPAFLWARPQGGKAFEYSIMAIRRRWLNFKSLYYGRHAADKFK